MANKDNGKDGKNDGLVLGPADKKLMGAWLVLIGVLVIAMAGITYYSIRTTATNSTESMTGYDRTSVNSGN